MQSYHFAVLFCAATISTLSAATYYVSPGGSDSANGSTIGTPWKTVSKVNSTALKAGDIVRFEGGQTFTGILNPRNGVAGTTASPVTFTSYGTGRATIAQTSLTTGGADLSGHSYIKINRSVCSSTLTRIRPTGEI